MKPRISEADFAVLVEQSGLPLSLEQRRDLFAVYGHLEQQVALVHAPLPREAEPALVFRCGAK
ncbi:hypothetical protein QMO56_20350 [Roseomonas sp. E05]|uniref:hypothetical protein n=1 Tax=Roseomonas sp. E05 TaxID=3046310 RepID=UPI0024B8B14A|nr:hypothetical protein [Roseomonas sp. E05]MDJ0390469.1 hypothetical protein [Roseomonas sp. E05]